MTHDRCGSEGKYEFLPTRLVYTKSTIPRLCMARDIEGFPKYATLSHCCESIILKTEHNVLKNPYSPSCTACLLNPTFEFR